jgi:hypothetical protein
VDSALSAMNPPYITGEVALYLQGLQTGSFFTTDPTFKKLTGLRSIA